MATGWNLQRGRGIGRDVVFEKNSKKTSLPLFVVVEIPAYTGPPFPKWSKDSKKAKWVPIPVYIATMSTEHGEKSRSARQQIPIALTRALTHHKAQGMSLDKTYIKLYSANSGGRQRLNNNFGILYTALSRNTDPCRNLLIERFEPEMLDTIANSDGMKAMQAEFKRLDEKARETAKWAEPLLNKFDELFEEDQHCRESKVVVKQIPLAPEKIINVITKPSKTNPSCTSLEASVNDYTDSRREKRHMKRPRSSVPDQSPNKRQKRDRTCSRRKRSAQPTTQAKRLAKKQRLEEEIRQKIEEKAVKDICEDVMYEDAERRVMIGSMMRRRNVT